MIDENESGPTRENLRTLNYFMGLIIDQKLSTLRQGTAYERVRPSDVRVFVAASRATTTISGIARDLHITRQSVQMSVHRLIELGVLALEPMPGNNRDKQVVLTARGILARTTAGNQIRRVEKDFAQIIGAEGVEALRQAMVKLVAANAEALYKSKPVDS
jgi:DNA-binding MarR family transcriptional regulator